MTAPRTDPPTPDHEHEFDRRTCTVCGVVRPSRYIDPPTPDPLTPEDWLTPLEDAAVTMPGDGPQHRRCVACGFVVWPRGGHQRECRVAGYLAALPSAHQHSWSYLSDHTGECNDCGATAPPFMPGGVHDCRAALRAALPSAPDQRLAELAELSRAASPGPWSLGRSSDDLEEWHPQVWPAVGAPIASADGRQSGRPGAPEKDAADFAFIVAAVNYVLAALSETRPEPTWCRQHRAYDHCEDDALARLRGPA